MHPVNWAPAALAELATIWNTAPTSDNQLLIWAVSDLVFLLERDPENEGESQPMNTRITFSWLLAIWFHVQADGTVWIRHIWW